MGTGVAIGVDIWNQETTISLHIDPEVKRSKVRGHSVIKCAAGENTYARRYDCLGF